MPELLRVNTRKCSCKREREKEIHAWKKSLQGEQALISAQIMSNASTGCRGGRGRGEKTIRGAMLRAPMQQASLSDGERRKEKREGREISLKEESPAPHHGCTGMPSYKHGRTKRKMDAGKARRRLSMRSIDS